MEKTGKRNFCVWCGASGHKITTQIPNIQEFIPLPTPLSPLRLAFSFFLSLPEKRRESKDRRKESNAFSGSIAVATTTARRRKIARKTRVFYGFKEVPPPFSRGTDPLPYETPPHKFRMLDNLVYTPEEVGKTGWGKYVYNLDTSW